MRKIFFILFTILLFSGCSFQENKSEDVFTVSDRQKQVYNLEINNQLQKNLWNFDETSNTFEKGYIVDQSFEYYDSIYQASAKMGFDIKGLEGKEAVVVSTKIQHFNNDEAGQAYFYFIRNKLVCEYYVYNKKIYSLSDINVFIKQRDFAKYEDNSVTASFEEFDVDIEFKEYADIYNSTIAVIDESKLKFYKLKKNKFSLIKEISFGKSMPIDVRFNSDGGCAVLLGKYEEYKPVVNPETDFIDDECSSEGLNESFIHSEKIAFLDKGFNLTSQEIALNMSTYRNLSFYNKQLFATRGNTIDVFQKDKEWSKVNQITLERDINKIRIDDIDLDGKKEFVITDGMDLYVYDYNGDNTLELIWCTHLSIRSVQDIIYLSDLNNDGVKEIYILDTMDTMARYILTSTGFETYQKEIVYGQQLITGDFNSDGKCDYISIDNINETKKMYLSCD